MQHATFRCLKRVIVIAVFIAAIVVVPTYPALVSSKGTFEGQNEAMQYRWTLHAPIRIVSEGFSHQVDAQDVYIRFDRNPFWMLIHLFFLIVVIRALFRQPPESRELTSDARPRKMGKSVVGGAFLFSVGELMSNLRYRVKIDMKILEIMIWVAITICFVRGLFVMDMGRSAETTYPIASGLCLAGSVIAAAIMFRRSSNNENR